MEHMVIGRGKVSVKGLLVTRCLECGESFVIEKVGERLHRCVHEGVRVQKAESLSLDRRKVCESI